MFKYLDVPSFDLPDILITFLGMKGKSKIFPAS